MCLGRAKAQRTPLNSRSPASSRLQSAAASSRRPTLGKRSGEQRSNQRARPGRLRERPRTPIPRGGPGRGPGGPETHFGDEAPSPAAGASWCQGPRTKQGSAGGAAPRALGGACTCIARRALALPGAPQLRGFAGSGFTRSHFVSPTPFLPSPLPSLPPLLPPLLIKTKVRMGTMSPALVEKA